MLATGMLARIAWRNVLRNRRRSVITILSMAIGLGALTFLWASIDAENEEIIENTTRLLAGEAQIHVKGYHDDPSLDLAIADAMSVARAIRDDPDVAAASVRMEGSALASRGDKSRGVRLVGVSPREEARVTSLLGAIVSGSSFGPSDSTGVLVGIKLAESLSLRAGDELILVGQAYDGSIASARVPVRGIFRTNIGEYDGYVAVMPLGAVRNFLSAPGGATAIVLRLKNRDRLDVMGPRLSARLGDRYEVIGWPTLLPEVAAATRFHVVVAYVVVGIFFVVVAAAVANPVLMAVLERTREFGVMLAIGMSPRRLLGLVLWEAVLLGLFGVAVGNLLGLGTTLYFGRAGIDLSAFGAGVQTMPGLSDVLRPVTRLDRSLMSSALVFGTACLAALYPAFKAARLDPVSAIHGFAGRRNVWRRHRQLSAAPYAAAHTGWPVFVLIATRNVLRNPRRTAITAGGTAFAIVGYVFLFGFFDGFDEQIIENATRYLTGHAQVERAGFRKDLAPEFALDGAGASALLARLRTAPHVAGAAPRIQAQAIASSATKSEGIAFIGVDPALERAVTFIDRTVIQGTALRPGGDRDILIGRRLAEKLDVRLGEKIVVMAQAAGGELGTAAFRVSGIFATESASFDQGMVFVTLPAAQALLALGPRVSTINIRVDDRSQLADVMAELRPWISASGYSVVPWQELLPQVDQMVRLIVAIRAIVMAIVLAVAAMAIMNTVFMSVAERTRELGVMMALGTRPGAVVRMVLYETAAIVAAASVAGYAVGVLLVSYFGRSGMDFSSFFRDYTTIPGITGIVYPRVVIASIVGPGVALFLASVLISVFPARRAVRLDPATAIRQT
jgi:ABC-type lipoprotein release transport system permease subunit